MFSNQPEVSTTSGSKVMAHYVIFTKVVTLTLIFIRFLPKKNARVLGTEYMSCRIFRKIGLVVWPVHRAITDRQTCNTENTWPWPFTFDLDLFPWPLTLIFDLETDLLLPWCFEENITKMYCFDVTWRKNGTSYVRTETNLPISILSVNILQPTRSLYGFRFQSYGSKGDFHGFWCVWPWPWHFKVIWFLWIRHLFPCMTGVNFEAISSLIAEI